ncbi:hypothetical protein FIBSPDRAFT_867721 [Athelia psychrophila]|uniref:Uncharacterized protein n=1 Tax=Athelia psychrophila TaxID=1759441 RepID=A0A166DP23_9AGAM|nr:hypothetical protein FIBSPDRAFT_867721 [Fibularhizoctonia sp. CBS 109695]
MVEPSLAAPTARTTPLLTVIPTDQPGIARTPSDQPAFSLPNTIHNTSNISGGTVNNVHGDLHNINPVNYNYYGSSPVASFNPASQPPPPLPPFNDAPIDRI